MRAALFELEEVHELGAARVRLAEGRVHGGAAAPVSQSAPPSWGARPAVLTAGSFRWAAYVISCFGAVAAVAIIAYVLGVADFGGIEALIDVRRSAAASVPLYVYSDGSPFPDRCLAPSPPGAAYALANASAPPEGWCAPAATGAYTQPLVLWYAQAADDHRTCGGTAGCAAAAMEGAGYNSMGTLCYARAASFVHRWRKPTDDSKAARGRMSRRGHPLDAKA